MNKQLIVTGDDYGLCESVNIAIEECLATGVMQATCVMANMPEHAQSARLKGKFPNCSVGIHWNLTQGRPVLDPALVRSLVDSDGRFLPFSRRAWLARRMNLMELRAELRAQYDRFRAVAGEADFWNTHQNVHVFPGMFQLCVQLAKELKIPAMRSHVRFTVPFGSSECGYHIRHPAYWIKGQVIARWSKQAEATGMLMPDGRIYMPGYDAGRHSFVEALDRIRWSDVAHAVEYVIHPAIRVETGLFGMLTQSRLAEYESFRQPQLKDFLAQRGVRLVGYEALRPAGRVVSNGVAA
jgi:predicted glycoside hydrolase/deacetylase ChbG (UPF0249 family)